MYRIFSFLFLVLVFSNCNNAPTEGVTVKLRLQKGDRFEQVMHMQMKMQQPMMGQTVEMTNGIGFTYHFEVVDDSAGWKKLSSTITRVQVDLTGMGQNMHYDSEAAADTTAATDLMANMFGSLKGSAFYFTVNDEGKVGQVSGFDSLQQKMGSTVPDVSAQKPFDEEGFRQNLQQSFAAYPPHPVKVGESWSRDMDMLMEGMKVNSVNTFTLQSATANDAVIKVQSDLKSDGSSQVKGSEMSMTGRSDGTITYDMKSGMPTTGTVSTTMNMKIMSEGKEVPMSMNMQTTIEGKKL